MAGVKGRSGRRAVPLAKKRLAAIDKAWDIVYDTLHSEEVSREEKVALAEKIVCRDLGRNISLDHTGDVEVFSKIATEGKSFDEIVRAVSSKLSQNC